MPQSDELAHDVSNTHAFATPDNVRGCIQYLNHSLGMLGFPQLVDASGEELVSLAAACNCIHAVLEQHQRLTASLEAAMEQQQRLQSEVKRLDKKLERCELQLGAKENEIQTMIGKERKNTAEMRQQMMKLQAEKDEFQRMAHGAQQVKTQQMYEMRKREKEFSRLQEKLSSLLVDKKEKIRSSIDIVNTLPEGRTRGTWNGRKEDGDFYKMLVDGYENKKAELVGENGELKMTLRGLQSALGQLLHDFGADFEATVQPPFADVASQTHTDLFDLPFRMSKESIEGALYEGLATLREMLDSGLREQRQRNQEILDSSSPTAISTRPQRVEVPVVVNLEAQFEESARALEEERAALHDLAVKLDREQADLDEERRAFVEEQQSFVTTLKLWAPSLSENNDLKQVLSPKLLDRLK